MDHIYLTELYEYFTDFGPVQSQNESNLGTMPPPAWSPLAQFHMFAVDTKSMNLSYPYGTIPEWYKVKTYISFN